MKLSNIFKIGLLSLLCTIGIAFSAQAQQQTHQVKTGETLFSIAKQYNTTVQNLRTWNSLSGNELSVGQSLVVSHNEAAKNATTHVVEAHETLFSISKKYGVSIPEIKSWNSLTDNNLNIGQELLIYNDGSNTGRGGNNKSIVVEKSTQRNTYYTVKSGDTLYDIARSHNMTVPELKTLNDLASNNIAIGQQLTVNETAAPPSVSVSKTKSSPQGKFVTYTVNSNQSLQQILSQFEMDAAEFEALNPGLSSSRFQRGQKVTVLAPPSKNYKNPYLTSANLKDLGKTAVAKYSQNEAGKPTTSGELYNPGQLTAAHSNIAIGTVMFIENPANNKGIYIRINDRVTGSGLKLSQTAWEALELTSSSPTVNIYQDQ